MSETHGDLESLENALKALVPVGSMPRDRAMFRAGQATAARRGWAWPLATLGMTALAAFFAVRPEGVPAERLVVVHVKEPVPSAAVAVTTEQPGQEPAATFEYWTIPTQHQGMEYLHLKQQALRFGIENLPLPMPPQGHVREAQTLEGLIQELSSGKSVYRY